MMDSPSARLTALALTVVLGAGCGSSPPTHFYLLSPVPGAEPSPLSASDVSIGVGPVTLPAYVDRPEIVTRTGRTELELADFHQWAEPLQANFLRVLAENLAALASTDQVFAYPWEADVRPRYRVAVDVVRFDVESGAGARLVARWTLLGSSDEVLAVKRSAVVREADSQDYASIASALSETIAALGQEIAAAIAAAESMR